MKNSSVAAFRRRRQLGVSPFTGPSLFASGPTPLPCYTRNHCTASTIHFRGPGDKAKTKDLPVATLFLQSHTIHTLMAKGPFRIGETIKGIANESKLGCQKLF